VVYEIKFNQAHINANPRITEEDDKYVPVFPHEARMRNLTYATELYVDILLAKKELEDEFVFDNKTGQRKRKVRKVLQEFEQARVLIGKIPVMLRSQFCQLTSLNQFERVRSGKDCQYDQGGYFIINGSEKVIVAQERMANNQVLVFHKKPPAKFSWVAEIRSQAENSNKPPQLLVMYLKNRFKGNLMSGVNKFGQCIYVNIPLIKEPIPLVVLFRALGTISDRMIMSRVCFDCPDDPEMGEALRPSLEEAKVIDSQEEALDFIAKRGSAQAYIKENRLNFTKLLLESEFLPHISVQPSDLPKKGYFLGYMTNKLLKAYLGRIQEDDRDYYGKKRLDMAGSLLAAHFRQLFR